MTQIKSIDSPSVISAFLTDGRRVNLLWCALSGQSGGTSGGWEEGGW